MKIEIPAISCTVVNKNSYMQHFRSVMKTNALNTNSAEVICDYHFKVTMYHVNGKESTSPQLIK